MNTHDLVNILVFFAILFMIVTIAYIRIKRALDVAKKYEETLRPYV
jgi:hypothetical protein